MTVPRTSGENKGLLWKLGMGVTPIPIVGDVALAMGFYDLLRDTPIKAAGIPAALITRFTMYQNLFVPLYEKFGLIDWANQFLG